MKIVDVAIRKKREVKIYWEIEEGDVTGILKMIFWTSKGGIGRWKLTEEEERFLVEIIVLVVCSSRVVKMKKHLPFCREFSILCIEDRVVVDHVV